MSLQPKPDQKKYTDLTSEIGKGKIKIPKFQRNFVWSLDVTAKLLDSILKGYPIGTFILWETKERLNDIKDIGNLELAAIPEGEKVQYVLDGQQRLTSLYAAHLGAKIQKEGEKKITDYKDIYVDLEKDVDDNDDDQIITSEKPTGKFISLHKILNALDHDDEIEENFDKDIRKKIRKYSQIFNTYDFSIVILRKEDIESAIEVFTRINTGGQTLTLFEIMSAKTYDPTQNFDMEEKFRDLLEDLGDKYSTISSSVILSVLSLVLSKNKECKRKIILQLNKQDIINKWDAVISAIKESIDYFRSVYRIPVSSLLPYDSLLVPFAYFFYNQKDKPKGKQIKYLEELFWRVSLSSRYTSATESKLAQDIKRVDEILNDKRPNYDDVAISLDSPEALINTDFRTGSSYCKAVLCLLAYLEPKDFQSNGKVILDNSWLKVANSKNYHHFFPKAFLKKQKIANANSLVNITLVSADLNKKKIKAKAPSIYIKEFSDENEELPNTLKSHLIDIDSGISSDDYNVFLEKRAQKMYTELKNRIELKNNPDAKQEEIHELILNGESDTLEIKSTLRFDIREEKVNKKLEYVIGKTISAFMNTEGGNLVIGVDNNGNILGLEKDYQSLQKPDKDGFELHLIEVIKKYLGEEYMKYAKVSFPKISDKEICWVKISKSGKRVFLKNEGNQEFYIRMGCSSQPLTREKQSEYEKLHWRE